MKKVLLILFFVSISVVISAQITVNNGALYNWGSFTDPSSWNIVDNVGVFASSPEAVKDLKNRPSYMDSTYGAGIVSGNATSPCFVKTNTYDYETNFSWFYVNEAYMSGVEEWGLYNLEAGDIILMRIRNQIGEYAAIKILHIDTVNYAGGHYDIFFEYKKNFLRANEICIVTIDTTTFKNKIIWERQYAASSYNIYKETAYNTYDIIGNVLYEEPNEFIDLNSNPETYGSKYKLSVINIDGSESQKSPYHKTINLVISVFGTTMGLTWTPYEEESGSFIPLKYYIYKGSTPNNMVLIDSISSSFTSYNDNNVFDSYYYMVSVRKNDGCDVLGVDNRESFSNKKKNFDSDVEENYFTNLQLYPNPAGNNFYIEINEDAEMDIYCSSGIIIKKYSIKKGRNNIDVSELNQGVYTIIIKNRNGISCRKLIKQ